MTVQELIGELMKYPDDTEVQYTYDSILSEITYVDYSPEKVWKDHKIVESGRMIVVLE